MFESVTNGVVVVAHPDDESLWCGGLLARYPARWTIICCSIPRIDPVRAWKFFDACNVLMARPRLLPFVETGPHEPMKSLDHLDLAEHDLIVTHNAQGEYGHQHHIDVHRHIAARWPDRMVTIGYGEPRPKRLIALTEAEAKIKRAALRCYDHVSPTDGRPKWQALLDRYGAMFDLSVETYTF